MSIILLNKPFGVLCQFTDREQRQTLASFINAKGYYAAGRLDRDSEGLVVLTNNGKAQHRISDPKHKLPKTYCVQVEGCVDDNAVAELSAGVALKDGITLPAVAQAIDEPAWLWCREPPIRERRNIPTSWLQLTLSEGRNRQVRRMTAAVGFPTLRLIRTAVGPWQLGSLEPGQHRRASVRDLGVSA